MHNLSGEVFFFLEIYNGIKIDVIYSFLSSIFFHIRTNFYLIAKWK